MKSRPAIIKDAALSSKSSTSTFRKLGVARFDFADPYHLALSLKWPQFLAVLVGLYMLINIGFALLYVAVPGCLTNVTPGSFADAFFFSVQTLSTVGYGGIAPATHYGNVVSAMELVLGMLLTATMSGLFFVRFSRPKARLLFANTAVVAQHNGRPTLMIRIGNGRLNTLTDVTARLTALLVEEGSNGPQLRRSIDLPLVRNDFPHFPLTWTVMHEIDEASPLSGLNPQHAAKTDLSLLLSVTARDPALGAEVYDARGYHAADLAFGMRYADAVTWEGSTTIADMRKLGDTEPDATGVK